MRRDFHPESLIGQSYQFVNVPPDRDFHGFMTWFVDLHLDPMLGKRTGHPHAIDALMRYQRKAIFLQQDGQRDLHFQDGELRASIGLQLEGERFGVTLIPDQLPYRRAGNNIAGLA